MNLNFQEIAIVIVSRDQRMEIRNVLGLGVGVHVTV